MAKFAIEYGVDVSEQLAALRAFEQRRILDRIEQELSTEPTTVTRNKKIISGVAVPWQHEEPMWELRVGEFRVFYDVNLADLLVTVRAIRHKPPHKTIEEIL